jgi:hypothetical protein
VGYSVADRIVAYIAELGPEITLALFFVVCACRSVVKRDIHEDRHAGEWTPAQLKEARQWQRRIRLTRTRRSQTG